MYNIKLKSAIIIQIYLPEIERSILSISHKQRFTNRSHHNRLTKVPIKY